MRRGAAFSLSRGVGSGTLRGMSETASSPGTHPRHSFKRKVYEALEGAPESGTVGKIVQVSLVVVIVLSIVVLVLESISEIRTASPVFFGVVEIVFVAVFTTEYVLRLWSAPAGDVEAGRGAGRARVRFALRPMMLVDLAAILPFFLPFLGLDLRAARLLRMFRLARVFKLARYTRAARSIRDAFVAKREELVVTVAFLFVLLMIAASMMHYAEGDTQPDRFGSIPSSMWWAIVTLTTVGYGDVVPVTLAGRLCGAVIAVIGIGFVALPTSILGSAFIMEYAKNSQEPVRCPGCGHEIPHE